MEEKLEQSLVREFPGMFDLDYGFAVGNGWYKLVRNLCREVYPIYKKKPFKVIQVKEKFGGLRFYTEPDIKEAQDFIRTAEEASFNICEKCGEWGKLRFGLWVKTLCDQHAKELGFEEKKKKVNTKIGSFGSSNKPKE
jgi:hypothetical protein